MKKTDAIALKQLDLQSKQIDLQIQQNKNVEAIIEKGIPVAERYFTAKLDKVESQKFRWTSTIGGLLLLIIVVGSMFLVHEGKLATDSFTFLIGAIVGYLMTFMKEVILDGE